MDGVGWREVYTLCAPARPADARGGSDGVIPCVRRLFSTISALLVRRAKEFQRNSFVEFVLHFTDYPLPARAQNGPETRRNPPEFDKDSHSFAIP